MTYRGFTLIETLIVIVTTALISVTLGVLLSYFYKTNAYTLEQTTAVAQARRGIEDSMRFLRESSYGSDGSYPIASVATSSITFYANVDTDSTIERVNYKLENHVFYRIIAEPNGNPLSYALATLATSTIATNVVNATSTPVFTYFDGTSAPLPSPISISDIASIQTTIVVDVNIARAPIAFTLSGGATLRNILSR
ncbi:MAG: hypothetical protein WAV50_02390 [Minisyncoccia bacterium]